MQRPNPPPRRSRSRRGHRNECSSASRFLALQASYTGACPARPDGAKEEPRRCIKSSRQRAFERNGKSRAKSLPRGLFPDIPNRRPTLTPLDDQIQKAEQLLRGTEWGQQSRAGVWRCQAGLICGTCTINEAVWNCRHAKYRCFSTGRRRELNQCGNGCANSARRTVMLSVKTSCVFSIAGRSACRYAVRSAESMGSA